MKGSPAKMGMIQGTAGHASALKMAVSPLKKEKDKITWGEEKVKKKTVTKNTKGGEDTKTDYETIGTSKGKKVEKYAKTPEEIAKWKAAPEKNKEKYKNKTHTKGRSETTSTSAKMKKIPTLGPKKVKVKTGEVIEPSKWQNKKWSRDPFPPKTKEPWIKKAASSIGEGLSNMGKNISIWKHKRKTRRNSRNRPNMCQ